MNFERALRDNPAPQRVGPVALRYDAPLLIGESPPRVRASRLPSLLYLVALCATVAALALLLSSPGASLLLPAGCAALAGASLTGAIRAERLLRPARRFVLHFGQETLSVETAGALFRGPTRVVAHFDDISDVVVERDARGSHTLIAEFRDSRAGVILADQIGAEHKEALQRLWTTLRAAFGVTRAEA